MQNRGILTAMRAAAMVIIATGINDVVASAVPRYEPLYLYLVVVAVVALLDGIVLGLLAAVLSIAAYALLFASALTPLNLMILSGYAIAATLAGAFIRGLVRSRPRPIEPIFEPMPPLLETSAVAKATDNTEVLAAIDSLRDELRTTVTALGSSNARATQIEHERDWAMKVAEEARTRADREHALREAAERFLAEAREESSSMAGRLAELELAAHETDRLRADVAELRRAVDLERGRAEGEKALREHAERDAANEHQRAGAIEAEVRILRANVAELELGRKRSDELQTALDELRANADSLATLETQRAEHAVQKAVELERQLAEERALRESQAAEHDKKLQTIVTHLASDHEADIGQAMTEKEEARAEARSLQLKINSLQKKMDEDHEKWTAASQQLMAKLRDTETLLAETRAAAQAEINRLRIALGTGAAAAASPRPRVLIVHPDNDIRATACTSLERAGYECSGAADGLEALRVATAVQPEVVIAEGSMPKMDGRELCQLLKSQEKTSNVRVILLMRANDELAASDLPPDEVLRKPVPVETLRNAVANLVAKPVPR